MATIHIGQESEGANCWQYQVQVQTRRQCYEFTITLNWLDYDHWSGGRVAPCVVAEAVMRFLLDQQPLGKIPQTFDCAAIGRRYPDLDVVLPSMF